METKKKETNWKECGSIRLSIEMIVALWIFKTDAIEQMSKRMNNVISILLSTGIEFITVNKRASALSSSLMHSKRTSNRKNARPTEWSKWLMFSLITLTLTCTHTHDIYSSAWTCVGGIEFRCSISSAVQAESVSFIISHSYRMLVQIRWKNANPNWVSASRSSIGRTCIVWPFIHFFDKKIPINWH